MPLSVDASREQNGRPYQRKKYDGEDVRPTTQKELWGWYSYGWAAEVFMICGVASFIPITLEQLARENGVLAKDFTTPCPADNAKNPDDPGAQCVVNILGWHLNTASFAMYTFSISVLLQAAVIVSMSGAADHGRFRKTLLLAFAYTGAVAMALFLPVTPSVFMLGALLAVVANVTAGAAFVLLNSFLPVLVRNHPAVKEAEEVSRMSLGHGQEANGTPLPQTNGTLVPPQEGSLLDSTANLLPASDPPHSNTVAPVTTSPALHLSTKISAYGIGIGYFAAVIFQLLAILILLFTRDSNPKDPQHKNGNFILRIILFLIGVWWAIFSIPAALFLRPRPGPPLPQAHSGSWQAYLGHSWKVLFSTIGRARKLKDVVFFLAAWFLLSDALATVSGTAILFAKTELGMPAPLLGMISVVSTLFGVLGALFWSWLSRKKEMDSIKIIIGIVALFELIPLYGLLAYIPAVKRLGFLGLQKEWEMYILAAVYGLVLGGVGAHCRAVFSELVPKGSEAAFYALYAITDKGSSVFGPAVVGAITSKYGNIRPAFVFLAVLVALPGPVLWLVDMRRGKIDADAAAHQFGDGEAFGDEDLAEQTVPLRADEEGIDHDEYEHEHEAQ